MAKKKRMIVEEPVEQYEFTPTEFNEREFILKDIYGSKVFLVTTALGLLVGIIGGILCNTIHMEYTWLIATAISFGVMGGMKKILALLGFHPEMLDMKTMVGNYLVYLALGLGVCILMINPPFV